MQRKLLLLILLTLPFTQVFTQNRQIDFIDPSINSHNEILTALSFPSLEGESYNALIRGQADTLAVEALTIYPERTFYFSGRDELMVYNHFGCYSYKEGMWQERELWRILLFRCSPFPSASEASYTKPKREIYSLCHRR